MLLLLLRLPVLRLALPSSPRPPRRPSPAPLHLAPTQKLTCTYPTDVLGRPLLAPPILAVPPADRARRVRVDVLGDDLRAHRHLRPLRRRQLCVLPPAPRPVRPPLELLRCVSPFLPSSRSRIEADDMGHMRRRTQGPSVALVLNRGILGCLDVGGIRDRSNRVSFAVSFSSTHRTGVSTASSCAHMPLYYTASV